LKPLSRFSLILAGTAGGVLSGIFLFLLIGFVMRPSWILNDRTLGWIRDTLARPIGLNWQEGSVSIHSASPLKKRLSLRLEAPCYSRHPELQICFPSLTASFTLNLARLLRSAENSSFLDTIHLLRFPPGRAVFQTPLGSTAAPQSGESPLSIPALPEWIRYTRIEEVSINLKEWSYTSSPGATPNRRATYRGDLQVVTSRLNQDSSKRNGRNLWKLQVREFSRRLSFTGRFFHSTHTSLDQLNYTARFQWRPRHKKQAQEILLESSGHASLAKIQGDFQGSIKNAIPALPELYFQNCHFLLKNRPDAKKNLQLDCPLRARPELPPELPESKKIRMALRPRKRLPLQAQLAADLAMSPSEGGKVRGHLRLQIDPIQTYTLIAHGLLDAEIAGCLPDFPRSWKAHGILEASARTTDFRRIVGLLNDSDWAIPAPLRALTGEIGLQSHQAGDLNFLTIPIKLTTRLSSRSQKLFTDSQGKLKIPGNSEKKPELHLATTLSEVQLVLPRLRFEQLPQVIPDPRIKPLTQSRTPELAHHGKSVAPLDYQLQFHTLANAPVRLVSNLAQTEIPLHLDLTLNKRDRTTEISGDLETGKFPLELFNRNAVIEKLLIGFTPLPAGGRTEHPIDGIIRVQYADYIVRVILNGTVEKPKITLTSTPPLPQDKLISVLLFGQPLEALDPQQSASIGDVSAAMANGAINFISLYLLASTPIQSVGYDPRTGVFSAKLKLGEGTSLNIGADPGELQRIEIQKRLGRFWTIVTEFNDPTAPERRSLQAFLEWSNRY
jgi:hypothetical protein